MKSEITIKMATPPDAAGLLKLMIHLVQESDTMTTDANLSKLTVEKERQQIAMINLTRTNVIILAKCKLCDIGVVTVQMRKPKQGELGIGVRKKDWNLGLGTDLVQEAIYWLNHYSRLKVLVLSVEDKNKAAFHIYKKCGFKITGHGYLNKSTPVTRMQLNRH